MFANLEYSLNGTLTPKTDGYSTRLEGVKIFNHVVHRGQLSQLWAKVLGKQSFLDTLPSLPVTSKHATTRVISVPIRQIKGSLGRNLDFDVNFNPLKERCRTRWISVFTALRMNIPLPPVELVQVDGAYYVLDGHHRISVVKAIGQDTVDAMIVN